MSKYISKEIFNEYKDFLPKNKMCKKISPFEFWEYVCETFGIVGEIEVAKNKSFIRYTYLDKSYIINRPYDEIIEVDSKGNTISENYGFLLEDALQDIIDRNLLKPKRKSKKKEKN
jgi:hypothetical protein